MTPHHFLLYYLEFDSVSPEVAPGVFLQGYCGQPDPGAITLLMHRCNATVKNV